MDHQNNNDLKDNNELKEINELLDIEEEEDIKEVSNNTDDIIHIEKNDHPHNASQAITREINIFDKSADEANGAKIVIDFDKDAIMSIIESALYISGNEGISVPDMKRITGLPAELVRKVLKEMMKYYDHEHSRGIVIRNFGERFKFFTKPCNKEALGQLVNVKLKNPLTAKVMETLAIIAYNQPCTKSKIENIREKDPTGTIQKLVELGLIVGVGRADTPGRPFLYAVSQKFYDIFGIESINELPKIEFHQTEIAEDINFFDTTRFNDEATSDE